MSSKKKKNKKKTNNNPIPSIKEEKNIIPIPKDKSDEFLHEINKKIVFVFKDYLHKECELAWLNETRAKSLIYKLSAVSDMKKSNIQNYSNIIRKVSPCEHKNEYKKLFCNKNFEQFENDFYEIDYWDTNRVFWYFISNIFHIVLIKNRHLKIDKK